MSPRFEGEPGKNWDIGTREASIAIVYARVFWQLFCVYRADNATTSRGKTMARKNSAPAGKAETILTTIASGDFQVDEFIVYPAHGVGKIIDVEQQEVAGMNMELFVIAFEKDKMMLRVPTGKAKSVGMRRLSTPETIQMALTTLKGRPRAKRTMWSRRAQEYEAKINSGDLVSIAEVVRDLYRSAGQPEQSYSERQLYEAALDRLARELAAVEDIEEGTALERVEGALARAA
jgi:CarD family transcriptional regulator